VPFTAALLYGTDHADKPRAAAATLGIDLNLIAPTSGHG